MLLESKVLLSNNFFLTNPGAWNVAILTALSDGSLEHPHVAYYICNCCVIAAVSDSPQSASIPVTVGMPISFNMSADGAGGEFHIDLSSSKSEKGKTRPPRPPPPSRRHSNRPASEIQIEGDAEDGLRLRTTSVANMDSGPPDSISCVRFACTFTKKNGKFRA